MTTGTRLRFVFLPSTPSWLAARVLICVTVKLLPAVVGMPFRNFLSHRMPAGSLWDAILPQISRRHQSLFVAAAKLEDQAENSGFIAHSNDRDILREIHLSLDK